MCVCVEQTNKRSASGVTSSVNMNIFLADNLNIESRPVYIGYLAKIF